MREAAGLLKVQSHAGNQNNHLNNYISSDYVFTRSLQYILLKQERDSDGEKRGSRGTGGLWVANCIFN